jgi:hypothetical protein
MKPTRIGHSGTGHLGDPFELWALGRSTRALGTWAIYWRSCRCTHALDPWAIRPARVVRRSLGALIWNASGAGLATNSRPRGPFERWAVDPQSIRNPLSAGQWIRNSLEHYFRVGTTGLHLQARLLVGSFFGNVNIERFSCSFLHCLVPRGFASWRK